jgi:hypothetical protein
MSYNDIEVQNVVFDTIIEDSASETFTAPEEVEFQELEVTADGLDRNEVAELVAIRREAQLAPRAGGETADNNGHAAADVALGVNLEPPEFVVRAGGTNRVDTGASNGGINDTDRSGQLDAFNLVVSTPGSGGANEARTSIALSMRSMFGRGPLLDRFDDLGVFKGLNRESMDTAVKLEGRYQLYYMVYEQDPPEFDLTFGRP